MAEDPLFALPARVESNWTRRRASQVRAAVERRVRRRRAVRWAIATSSLILVGGLGLARLARQPRPADVAMAKPASSTSALPRPTTVEPMATPLTADTELVVDPRGAGRAFVLRQGSARFVVPHDDLHPFRVRVGPLVVEDIGTIFSVTRLSDYQFDVAVEEGRVAVLCESRRVELGGAERRTFACGEPAKQATVALSAAEVGTTAKVLAQRPPRVTGPAWRILAERGQYQAAYVSLHSESTAAVRDETHELLLAADTARLSGHSNEAVPYLRRILVQHGSDPRADLVAFTLGRVLLDELGRCAEAAEAFERARARHAPLAEDALAREIEAWARAGDARRAHSLALEYQRSYPQGRRMRAVAKFGGLAQ
jgi:transmembrane sensor